MDEYSLEKEFEFWKQLHMQGIVLGALLNYYRDLVGTNAVPTNDDVEVLAKTKLLEFLNDPARFNKIYNEVWEAYKEAFV